MAVQSDYSKNQLDISTKKGKEDVYWNDIKFPLTGQNLDVSSGRIDYNYYNGTVAFQSNSRYPNEAISMICQLNHDWKFESELRPHIHWKQQSVNIPNFLLAYKVKENGDTDVIETDYSNHTFTTISSHAFTYTSGVMDQISSFPVIDMSGIDSVSAIIHFVLFRDTGDISTEFGASDPSGLVEHVIEFDIHYQRDRDGSEQEYTKEA